MIDRLVQILAQGWELSAEEILDVLWLAATQSADREAAALAPAGTAPEGSAPESDRANDAGVPVAADGPDEAGRTSGTDAEVPLHLGGDVPGADDASPPVPATEVAFGAPRPIRDPLTLPMALRRLRRIRAPGPVVTVDIDATVEATADADGRLITILTRLPERALDLALVVDGAPSMDIWAGTFDELERLLAQTGAFRSVSRWTLRLSGDAALLESRDGRAQPPRRLTDPSGRRLVLLATDGRHEAWYSTAPWAMLDAWCAAMPTALLQVLPQHYWATTAVGDPYLTATAMRPAAPNSQYLRRLAWWADDPGGVPLPVVTLSPQAMETWVQVVAGGTAWATGITAVPPAPDSAPSAVDGADPLMLVNDFRSRASSGAQRLARILASTETLSMPLIEVLQDRLAPETGVLERAEVLASGMLALNRTADGQTLFGYRPGIPEILRRGVTTFEEWDTYAAVSQYLEDRHRLGGPLHALIADPAGTAKLDAAETPFAALHESLAVRLGLRDSAGNQTASSTTPGPSESEDQAPGEAEHVPRDQAGSPLLDEAGDVLLSEAAADIHDEADLREHAQDANFKAPVGDDEPVTALGGSVPQGRGFFDPTLVTSQATASETAAPETIASGTADPRLLGPTDEQPAGAPSPAEPPDRRYFNAELEDHPADEPLRTGQQYTIALATTALPDEILAKADPAIAIFELTVQLDSDDFDILGAATRPLRVPRSGRSLGKARFDIVPRHDGDCELVASVYHDGNFVHQVKLTIPVGGPVQALVAVTIRGRPPDLAAALEPRDISILLEPAPSGGFVCTVNGAVAGRTILPITATELNAATTAARKAMMNVITTVHDGAYVFQAGIDIPPEAEQGALRTLARVGASLFQRLFLHDAAGNDARAVGEWLRDNAMDPGVRLTVQVIADHAPLPWALLYLGDAGINASLDWGNFLGMRHIIEQLPLQQSLRTVNNEIPSKPALAVSLNMNHSIDAAMGMPLVAGHERHWTEVAAARAGLTVVSRATKAEVIRALADAANGDRIVYFYCHATGSATGNDPETAGIIMGQGDATTVVDLRLDAPVTVQLPGNPLVVINACESAELSPLFYSGFVPYFMAKGARGVIGTEYKTPAIFAIRWADAFFEQFLDGATVGETVLKLRQDFLRDHGNPLGLIYAVHCDADTRVTPALARAQTAGN